MSDYQKEQKKIIDKLTKELAPFVDRAYTEYSEMHEYFYTVLVRNKKEYHAHRDYKGFLLISEKEWKRYKHVSQHAQNEISQKYKQNNIKVPTQKKIFARMDAIDHIVAECDALELQHAQKINAFLATVAPHEPKYSYHHEYKTMQDGTYKPYNTDIAGGEIVKNGLVFTFNIEQDGYIAKKITVHYSVDNTLDQFLKMTK